MVRAKQIHSLGEGVSKLFDGLHSSAEQACIELHVGASSGEFGNHPPIKLNVVHVEEKSAPPGTKPIEWFLLTTLPTNSQKQTERVGQRYRLRWRIEAWHRIPKSSCKVELLAHRTGDRIERAVTIKAVIAKRLAAMTIRRHIWSPPVMQGLITH